MSEPVSILDEFFERLERPQSPNNWLVAPDGCVVEPDVVAPLVNVPPGVLFQALKAVVVESGGVVVEETATAMHAVVTTPLLLFKDDVWALVLAVPVKRSTLAIYSASRVGYWDFGTNRRRLNAWIQRLEHLFAGNEPAGAPPGSGRN